MDVRRVCGGAEVMQMRASTVCTREPTQITPRSLPYSDTHTTDLCRTRCSPSPSSSCAPFAAKRSRCSCIKCECEMTKSLGSTSTSSASRKKRDVSLKPTVPKRYRTTTTPSAEGWRRGEEVPSAWTSADECLATGKAQGVRVDRRFYLCNMCSPLHRLTDTVSC